MKLSIEKLKELLPSARPDRRGKNLRAICPMCGHDEFGISTEDNHVFGCYRRKKCGWSGNLFTLAKFLKRMDLLNIEGEVGLIEKVENKIIRKDVPLDLSLPTITMPVGWRRVYQDDYLHSRGFTEFERYKVGRTNIDPRLKKNYVVTAIEDNGEIKGYIGRHVWSKSKIDEENKVRKQKGIPEVLRYINSDTDFAKVLFGYDEIITGKTKTIICVEGIFDFWNINKIMNLHTQEAVKCNGTFKCAISPEQIQKWLLKGVENLILFYDPDVVNEIKEAAAQLQLYFNVLVAFNDNEDKDAGDITEEEGLKIFSDLKSPSDFISNKIGRIIKNY